MTPVSFGKFLSLWENQHWLSSSYFGVKTPTRYLSRRHLSVLHGLCPSGKPHSQGPAECLAHGGSRDFEWMMNELVHVCWPLIPDQSSPLFHLLPSEGPTDLLSNPDPSVGISMFLKVAWVVTQCDHHGNYSFHDMLWMWVHGYVLLIFASQMSIVGPGI